VTHCFLAALLGKCCQCTLPFISPNWWKSDDTTYGPHGECGRTVQPMCLVVFKLVWSLVLLCYKRKVVFFSGLILEAWGFSSSVLQCRAQSWRSVQIPENPSGSHSSYPKRQCTSLYLLRAASRTFSLIKHSHVAISWTVILILACSGGIITHYW